MKFFCRTLLISSFLICIFGLPDFTDASSASMVGYWKFDEGSGVSATDSSGSGNTATLLNGATYSNSTATTSFANPSGLNLDGTDDYVSVTDSASLRLTNKFSISAWVKSSSNSRYILSKNTYNLSLNSSGNPQFTMYDYSSTEKLTNGGFEAPYSGGLATGWTGGSGTPSQETTIVHDGGSSQKVVSSGGFAGVNQTLTLTNGRTYMVSGWVYVASGQISVAVQQINSPFASYGSATASATSSWQFVQFTAFAATYGSTVGLRVYDTGAAATYYLDGFSMREVLNSATVTSSSALTSGVYNHIAVTYNGSTLSMYLNNNATSTSTSMSMSTTTDNFVIGNFFQSTTTTNYAFNGLIDDVRVYNQSLSTSAISSIYGGNHVTATWTGATDNSYGTASNWDVGIVPDRFTSAVIANTSYQPVVSVDEQVNILTVNSGGKIMGSLDNTLNMTANDFKIKSGGTISNLNLNLVSGATISENNGDTSDSNLLLVGNGVVAPGVYKNLILDKATGGTNQLGPGDFHFNADVRTNSGSASCIFNNVANNANIRVDGNINLTGCTWNRGTGTITLGTPEAKIVASSATTAIDHLTLTGFNFWPDGLMGVLSIGGLNPLRYFAAKGTIIGKSVGTLTNPFAGSSTSTVTISSPKDTWAYQSGGPIYKDNSTGNLIMFWHGEKHFGGDSTKFWSSIGLAKSTDSGATWVDLGAILSPSTPFASFTGSPVIDIGGGGFAIVNGYVYLYFSDQGQSLNFGVARALLSDVLAQAALGTVPTFTKYYQGSFSQSGLGGLASELNGPSGFVDVTYHSDTSQYIAVGGKAGPPAYSYFTIYSIRSSDGINWHDGQRISDENNEAFYSSILTSDGNSSRTSTGPLTLFYTSSVAGGFNRWNDAVLSTRTLSVSVGTQTVNSGGSTLEAFAVNSSGGTKQLSANLHVKSYTNTAGTLDLNGFTIQTDPSDDAKLSGLSVSSGSFSPAFSSTTMAYTESVASDVSSITVTPTVNQANATVTVNGTTVSSGSPSGSISLSEGSNTITIIVTAQDTTTTSTYTITVTRAATATSAPRYDSRRRVLVQAQNTQQTVPRFTSSNLRVFQSSVNVRYLQAFLNQKGFVVAKSGPGSSGNETTFFGPLTLRALKLFQASVGLPSTGYFGPLTRAYIESH